MLGRKSFAVVGAGIIGCAVARDLTRRFPGSHVLLLEKESRVARHQTGHNSGVVHAGLYYEPGGLKARLCRKGVAMLRNFSLEKGLAYEECGKLVVALDTVQEHRLAHLYQRAVANEVPGVRMLGPDGIRDVEPNVSGLAAVQSPATAIVDYSIVAEALVQDVVQAGGELRLHCEVQQLIDDGAGVVVQTSLGDYRVDYAVVCAGVQSDRIARHSGGAKEPSIVPFIGQYFRLDPAYDAVVNGLVYPVPDPKYPFLGVHLTKRVDGAMLIGPNAFLSFSREGYHGLGLNVRDLSETLKTPGFWRFVSRNGAAAVREAQTVLSKQAFLRGAQKYVPALDGADATRLTRGIRAQALDKYGNLVDDFRIDYDARVTHVRNAPSPGATSSMAIAEYIVDSMTKRYEIPGP